MDVLLTGIQMFKFMNCVTLCFTNTELYSRIYVASCSEEIFLDKCPELKGTR